MNFYKKALLALSISASIGLCACLTSYEGNNASYNPSETEIYQEYSSETKDPQDFNYTYKIMALTEGIVNDGGFNEACIEGFKNSLGPQQGLSVRAEEYNTIEEIKENLINASKSQSFDLIACIGSNYKEPLAKICKDYPEQSYILIDEELSAPNVTSLMFSNEEAGFLAGAAAAMFTTTKGIDGINPEAKIAFAGGLDANITRQFYTGFEQGALYINPDTEVLLGFTNIWSDEERARALCSEFFDAGADIVFNCGSGLGTLYAARDSGHFAIGVDINQDSVAPGSVLCSALKHVDIACEGLATEARRGTLIVGKVYSDLERGGVGLTDFSVIKEALGESFPEYIPEKIKEIEQKIVAGEIKIAPYSE